MIIKKKTEKEIKKKREHTEHRRGKDAGRQAGEQTHTWRRAAQSAKAPDTTASQHTSGDCPGDPAEEEEES